MFLSLRSPQLTAEKTESLYPAHRVLPSVDFSGRDLTAPDALRLRAEPDIYSAGYKPFVCRSYSTATDL